MRFAELNEHDVELLTGKALGHLATLMPDGSPHVTPVWIDAKDGLVLVNSEEGRVKTNNVRRDPRVAISVTAVDDPYDVVAIRGRVVDLVHEGARQHIDELSRRYTGQAFGGGSGGQRVIFKIRPEQISR